MSESIKPPVYSERFEHVPLSERPQPEAVQAAMQTNLERIDQAFLALPSADRGILVRQPVAKRKGTGDAGWGREHNIYALGA